MYIKYLVFLWFIFFLSTANAQDTLYINRGIYTIQPETIHKISINASDTFHRANTVLDFNLDEALEFYIINNDSIQHTLDGAFITPITLAPSEGTIIEVAPQPFGTYLIHLTQGPGKLLGAGLIIRIGINGTKKYNWDLWDQSPELAKAIFEGEAAEIPSVYRPTFFSINGGVEPMDATAGAMIMGTIGDSIYISIVNTGNMIHTIHFHGYHIEIMQSLKKPESVGWRKDSFPVFVKDAMTVLLIPHQAGHFPVHNHNLVATLFNNANSLGIVTMIMIQE